MSQQIAAYLALFLVLELVFYIRKLYDAMALTFVVFTIFAIVFFLLSSYKGNSSFISTISDVFKPPHKRIKKVTVGIGKTPDNTIIRLKEKTEALHYNESGRNNCRNDSSIKDPTSCIIKIPNSGD